MEVISIIVLVVMFVIATTMPINMGALGLIAAAAVGVGVVGLTFDQVIFGVPDGSDITGGFPGDLFLLLVGLTYLFAMAADNGTVDLLVHWAMRSVGGRVTLAPFVFFAVSCGLAAIGALFAVAIVAPLAMPFARRYGINLLLMGMMVVHGALGGAFSPIAICGAFVNSTMERVGFDANPVVVFVASLVANIVFAVALYLVLGGRTRLEPAPGLPTGCTGPASTGTAPSPTGGADEGTGETVTAVTTARDVDADAVPRLNTERLITVAGLVVMTLGTVLFGFDVGVASLAVALVLRLVNPKRPDVIGKISWSTVVLVCGVITYVGVLTAAGTIDFVSSGITAIGVPLVAALLLCYVGGVLSAFASSVAILGVSIPLAVPFLQQGAVSVLGMIAALSVATTVVDVSPFSTNGALVLANTPADVDRDRFYKQMLVYAGIVVVVGPLLAWALLVLPTVA